MPPITPSTENIPAWVVSIQEEPNSIMSPRPHAVLVAQDGTLPTRDSGTRLLGFQAELGVFNLDLAFADWIDREDLDVVLGMYMVTEQAPQRGKTPQWSTSRYPVGSVRRRSDSTDAYNTSTETES